MDAKQRSKLVLPAPQISDTELEEVVKLGMTSEKSKLLAEDARNSEMATQDLLASYSVTPQITPGRTPRTPASQDVILQVYPQTISWMGLHVFVL